MAKKAKKAKKPRVRKARDPLDATPGKKRVRGDPAAVFAIKLRMEGVTGAHLIALAPLVGKKPKKVRRNDLRDYLHANVKVALDKLVAGSIIPASSVTAADDLLS